MCTVQDFAVQNLDRQRVLDHALQRMVQDPLAIKILDGEVLHGAHVRIDVDRKSNQLKFEPMGREAMA